MQTRRSKTNVLFVMLQLSMGGTERIVLELARNLNEDFFDVYVASFAGGTLESQLRQICKEIFLISKKAGFDLNAMMQLSGIIDRENIHVVNAHHYMPFFYSFLGARVFRNAKLIYTEHSVAEVDMISNWHMHIFNSLLYRTNTVVGVSNEVSEAFRKKFPRHSGKFMSIPNGVDIERFSSRVERLDIRAHWGFSPEDYVIGTVANFRYVKNHVCLVRAFQRLSTVNPNARLILVGKGYPGDLENSEEEVRRLVAFHELEDRVVFAGYQEDIPSILQCLDVFCLPSFSEGLPVSILEAMAAGVPVVGSDVRGIREVVSHNETGLLFPVNDHDALAQQFIQLQNDRELSRKIIRSAFDFVCRNHGIARWTDTYEQLFRGNGNAGSGSMSPIDR